MKNNIQCVQCGELSSGTNEFCSKCGSNLVSSAAFHSNQPNTVESSCHSNQTGRSFSRGKVFLSAVVFAIVGPPIGGLLFFTIPIIKNITKLSFEFKGILLVAVFSYILGFIPAFITGLVHGYFIQYYNKINSVIISSVSSLVVSFITAVILSKGKINSFIIIMSVVGLLSCLLISTLYRTQKTT